jgi:hypothetical protein
MSVCVYSESVLSCVQVAALRQADPPSKESYRVKYQETKAQQRATEPSIDKEAMYGDMSTLRWITQRSVAR